MITKIEKKKKRKKEEAIHSAWINNNSPLNFNELKIHHRFPQKQIWSEYFEIPMEEHFTAVNMQWVGAMLKRLTMLRGDLGLQYHPSHE
jgi:hypothetical protein